MFQSRFVIIQSLIEREIHKEHPNQNNIIITTTNTSRMATQTSNSETQPTAAAAPKPTVTYCRKKKSESATFYEDVKDHIDEFIHASMDEHKTCFKNTIQKMFDMSKIVAERNSDNKGVESSLPLQTTNFVRTETPTAKSETPQPTVTAPEPTVSSCRKKKSESANLYEDVKDHIDDFIHASMDEHKTCFKNTMQKMFGMSKIVTEKNSDNKGVESSLPIQTTVVN